MTEPLTIVVAIYDGVTQLDFTGPHQFFTRLPDTTVIVACVGSGRVKSNGLTFSDLADLCAVAACDVLFVPGGDVSKAISELRYMASVRRLAQGARYITSVCTGSLILGAAGLLRGKRAGCHWAYRELLPMFGAIPDPARVVRDGNVFTGGGITAGIDFALAVIAEIAGRESAETTQLFFEYAPEPPFGTGPGRPETAAPSVRDALANRFAADIKARLLLLGRAAAQLQ